VGLSIGTYEVQDIGGKPGSLLVSSLVFDSTFGSHIRRPIPECCNTSNPQFQPGFFEVESDGLWNPFLTLATDACAGGQVPLDMLSFWPNNPAIAQMTSQGVKGLLIGSTTGNGESDLVWVGQGSNCILRNLYPTASITVEPEIVFNGKNINDTTQSVVVGQQIALTASYSLPSGVTVRSRSWSVAGTTVGGFDAANLGGGPKSTDFNKDSNTFYWVNAGNSLKVTFTLTLSDGSKPTAKATFNVGGAAVSKMTTPTGSVGIFSGPVLGFGPVGIQFNPTLTTPSGDAGQFVWAQLITNNTLTLTSTSGTVYTCVNVTQPPTSGGTGLDTEYPYATGKSTQDSPDLGLNSSAYTKEATVFSASMYLLWDPALPTGCTPGSNCTSIPAPLGSVTWGWSGTAVFSSGNWSLTASSKTTPTWAASSSYPTWTDFVPYNGQISCH
jgi:hypothetical protein